MRLFFGPLLAVSAMALAHCTSSAPNDDGPDVSPPAATDGGLAPGSSNVPPRHAGFVELPPRSLRFPAAPDVVATTGRARLAYRFAPADDARRPLCVAFSGGPGVTSTMMQRGFGIDQRGSGLLGRACHALVIDQRNTGFSYNLDRDVSGEGTARFTLADNNAFSDAFDFVWVLLEVLERHPELAGLPLLILGESYGGVRATLMVDLLVHTDAYARDERRVVDPALLSRLEDTASIVGVHPGDNLRYQVLVQPVLAGRRQDEASGLLFETPGSVVFELASELGRAFTPCGDPGCAPYFNALNQVKSWGRSSYDSRAPTDWLERKLEGARALMNSREGMTELLTVDPLRLPELAAPARTNAWRLATTDADEADTDAARELLGTLGPDDRYFVPFNDAVFVAFSSNEATELGVDWLDPDYAEIFVGTLRRVPTFVTRARYDLVNFSPGFLQALAETSGVSSFAVDVEGDAERAGWLVIRLDDGELVRVRSPEYMAGHGVVGDSGEEFVADLVSWIAAP